MSADSDKAAATPPSPLRFTKEPTRIAGMFDAIAGRYDLLNRILSVGLDKSWRERTVNELELAGTEVVLDLCTGTGDLALAMFSSLRRPRAVIGVDFSGAMLLLAKDKIRQAGTQGKIALARGDAARIPLGSESVDVVTIAFGIRNVQDPDRVFREIARVLKRSGRVAILEFSLPRTPLVRGLYLWYFRKVLPLVGRLVSRHPSAYTYLPESVEAFPSPEAFLQQLGRCGFSRAYAIRLTFGAVYLFVATSSELGAQSA
jgi:demethylmenaquinone methyltransferase / 2-methoxy-6-polyprenyl-1,4-benzoquinol methylase